MGKLQPSCWGKHLKSRFVRCFLRNQCIRAPSICRLKQSSTTKINTRLAWRGPRAPYRLRTFRLFLTGVRASGSMGTFIIEISSAKPTWCAFAKCSCRQVPPATALFSLTITPPHMRKASKAHVCADWVLHRVFGLERNR